MLWGLIVGFFFLGAFTPSVENSCLTTNIIPSSSQWLILFSFIQWWGFFFLPICRFFFCFHYQSLCGVFHLDGGSSISYSYKFWEVKHVMSGLMLFFSLPFTAIGENRKSVHLQYSQCVRLSFVSSCTNNAPYWKIGPGCCLHLRDCGSLLTDGKCYCFFTWRVLLMEFDSILIVLIDLKSASFSYS